MIVSNSFPKSGNPAQKTIVSVVACSILLQTGTFCLAVEAREYSGSWQQPMLAEDKPSATDVYALVPRYGSFTVHSIQAAAGAQAERDAGSAEKIGSEIGATEPSRMDTMLSTRLQEIAAEVFGSERGKDEVRSIAPTFAILADDRLSKAKPMAELLDSSLRQGHGQECIESSQQLVADLNQPTALKGGIAVEPTEARKQIEELTRQILLKEIELQKFNLRYSLEVAKQGRWKGWRYAAFQEANTGLSLAGATISVYERGHNLHTPKKVNSHVQESANYISMIGSIIGAGAAALELGINEYHELEAARKGFSPTAARKHVEGLRNEINGLLRRHEELRKIEAAAPELAANVEIDMLEAKVLSDLRDQALLEYERFHVGGRKLLAFQQSQYFFDLSKYTLNTLGYVFAYLSLTKKRRVYNGYAGLMWDIAGPVYISGPIVSRLIADRVGKLHRRRLRGNMPETESAALQALIEDRAQLEKICAAKHMNDGLTSVLDRTSLYGLHEKKFEDEYFAAERAADKAKLTATQNIAAGAYVGGTKLAQGVLFTVPGFNKRYNGKTPRADRVTNDNLFAASVISLPANLFSILDTLRIQVRGEIDRQRAIKAQRSPHQLTQARLSQLDEMEQALNKLGQK